MKESLRKFQRDIFDISGKIIQKRTKNKVQKYSKNYQIPLLLAIFSFFLPISSIFSRINRDLTRLIDNSMTRARAFDINYVTWKLNATASLWPRVLLMPRYKVTGRKIIPGRLPPPSLLPLSLPLLFEIRPRN